MTIQTKHYIEPSDIIALRITCKKCGVALSTGIGEKFNIMSLRACPSCGESWTVDRLKGSSLEPTIEAFVAAAKKLTTALQYRADVEGGFSVGLEIKAPLPSSLPNVS